MKDQGELDRGSFNSNYIVLKETAAWLSNQEEPDIDQLVPKVERAMRAYAICQERLGKVQQALGEFLEEKGGDEESPAPLPSRERRPMRGASSPEGDGETGDTQRRSRIP